MDTNDRKEDRITGRDRDSQNNGHVFHGADYTPKDDRA